MAKTRKHKKNNGNTGFIIIGIVLLAVLVALIATIIDKSQPHPTETATQTPENTATQAVTNVPTQISTSTANIVFTVEPTPTVNVTDTGTAAATTNTATVTPTATLDITQPLEVPEDKVFALHITVDSGEYAESEDIYFDDAYNVLIPYGQELNDVQLVVFLTDYKGNSHIAYFGSTSASMTIKNYLLPGSGTPQIVSVAKNLDITVDRAHNATVKWAGNTLLVTGEEPQKQAQYVFNNTPLVLTVDNLDLMDKSMLE